MPNIRKAPAPSNTQLGTPPTIDPCSQVVIELRSNPGAGVGGGTAAGVPDVVEMGTPDGVTAGTVPSPGGFITGPGSNQGGIGAGGGGLTEAGAGAQPPAGSLIMQAGWLSGHARRC